MTSKHNYINIIITSIIIIIAMFLIALTGYKYIYLPQHSNNDTTKEDKVHVSVIKDEELQDALFNKVAIKYDGYLASSLQNGSTNNFSNGQKILIAYWQILTASGNYGSYIKTSVVNDKIKEIFGSVPSIEPRNYDEFRTITEYNSIEDGYSDFTGEAVMNVVEVAFKLEKDDNNNYYLYTYRVYDRNEVIITEGDTLSYYTDYDQTKLFYSYPFSSTDGYNGDINARIKTYMLENGSKKSLPVYKYTFQKQEDNSYIWTNYEMLNSK